MVETCIFTELLLLFALKAFVVCSALHNTKMDNAYVVRELREEDDKKNHWLVEEEELCYLVPQGLALRLRCSSHPALFTVTTPVAAHNTLHHLSSCNRQFMKILARCNDSLSWHHQIVMMTYEAGIRHLLREKTISDFQPERQQSNFTNGTSAANISSADKITSASNYIPADKSTSKETVYPGNCIIDAVQKTFEEFLIRDPKKIKLKVVCDVMLMELLNIVKEQQCIVNDFDQFRKNFRDSVNCTMPKIRIVDLKPVCNSAAKLSSYLGLYVFIFLVSFAFLIMQTNIIAM